MAIFQQKDLYFKTKQCILDKRDGCDNLTLLYINKIKIVKICHTIEGVNWSTMYGKDKTILCTTLFRITSFLLNKMS